MATWQNTSLIMLRTMLNDAGCSESTYSNKRLEDLLITSAYLLPAEANFSNDYTIDVELRTVSPDPAASSTADGVDFINLMVLKAACMADQGSFRDAALLQGVSARVGPASIQTSNYGAYLHQLLKDGPCASYKTLLERFNYSYDGKQIIRAVMSPFVSNNFDPSKQTGGSDDTFFSSTQRNRGY